MNNKLVITTLLAATGLGLSTLSLAEASSTDAHAAHKGFYVGGQLGYVNSSIDNDIKNNTTAINQMDDDDLTLTTKLNHIAGRLYVGYQFNPYLALEGGYTYLGNDKTTLAVAPTALDASGSLSQKLTTQAFDLAAKGILPLSVISDSLSNASLFAKVGVASVIYSVDTKGTITNSTDPDSQEQYTDFGVVSTSRVLPEFGGGAEYVLDNGLGFDVSYMRLQGHKNSSETIPSQNTLMGGVSYHFAT